MTPQPPMSAQPPVIVRAPGKVNIHLAVGPRRPDGYHDLATVFQAVSIYDEVQAEPADRLVVTVAGPEASLLTDGRPNIAARAALLVAACAARAPGVRIHIRKVLPVAGGMAGGSADAAATLLACNALWGVGLGPSELRELAARLGSDVPFMLTGGTAIGRGRGELLTPLTPHRPLHWVFAFPLRGLATPDVYAEFDRTCGIIPAAPVDVAPELCHAIERGAAGRIVELMRNDLEHSALRLQPRLRQLLRAGLDLGACGAILSGTGATCAFLASNEKAGRLLAAALDGSGLCRRACYANGPVAGPEVLPAVLTS